MKQAYVALVERTAGGNQPAPGAKRHDLLVTFHDGEHPIDVARRVMRDRGFPSIHVWGCFGEVDLGGKDSGSAA